ncbi:DUF3575 domain-containing protein [Dyadobacter arcticus]|uniref:DUF3575 domain-containing protein n=1 Tax=Dyadobacter arcticus TaxID=1078754 RepID=A0ABX0UTG3_9BACT|nr:DUF3575 domain-containing protein [Dyadobacter arcticus]NIJ54995.1 hypothetical protein [Dyadobacter arcticus]
MRLLLILGVWLALGSTNLQAQIDAFNAKSHVIIKYSPLPMFDLDNTIQFGVEVPLGKSGLTIQEDLGYGHSSFSMWYRETSDVPNKATFKSRTQLRYYYFDRRRVRGYVGGEFLYKKVVYRENEWVGMDCSGFGGCNYFEEKKYKVGRFIGAGHARLGWQFYFPSRMTMDLFTGLGWRKISVRTITPGLENTNITIPDEFWTNANPNTKDFVPSLVLGFHLGIVLGKFDN